MTLLCIQHVSFEGPAAIAGWCEARGIMLRVQLASEWFSIPRTPSGFDALVLLGGPMSANDDARLPWMKTEIAFLRDTIASGKKALGICLGAQLLARALGAEVTPNPCGKEIGWYPVEAVCAHPLLPMDAGDKVTVFHWHGETFALPAKATHILRSSLCENQAFVWEKQVLALQCHPEATPDSIRALSAESHIELQTCGLPTSGESFQRSDEGLAIAHQLLGTMLDRFFLS
jgi:GMP synthase-like glutamine amidotransferase